VTTREAGFPLLSPSARDAWSSIWTSTEVYALLDRVRGHKVPRTGRHRRDQRARSDRRNHELERAAADDRQPV